VHDVGVEPRQFFLAQADGEPFERWSLKLLEESSEDGRSGDQERRVFDVQFEQAIFNVGTRQHYLLTILRLESHAVSVPQL